MPSKIIRAKKSLFIWFVILVLSAASSAFAYDYQATAIQPPANYTASRAMGINNLGEVVGRFYNTDAQGNAVNRQAFVWDPTNGAYLLKTLIGESSGWDINDNGFATGYSYNAAVKQRAVLWDLEANTIEDLGGLMNPTTRVYGESSTGYGINNLDQVVGSADIPNDANTFTPFHAFLDDGNGLLDLGTFANLPEWQDGYSIAYDINNNGEIVGIAHDDSLAFLPFIYDKTNGMKALQRASAYLTGEWYAVVINDAGLIGGHVIAATNQSLPYYWPNKSSAPIKITMPAGFPYGEIYGINASGQMVGIMWSSDQAGATEHAFIFDTQNGVRDLNNLIDPSSGWVLDFARGINDSGQIAGYGELNGNKRAFMLTLQSLTGAFNGGTWRWDGSSWSRISPNTPQNMVASGTILYGDFGTSGIWKWNGSAWSQVSSSNPESMVASGTILYADFGVSGIWKWDGSLWSRTSTSNPESMAASGTILYADFGVSGIWKWDGSVWSQISASNPETMVASGTILYGDFGASGIWKWNGSAWSQISSNNPESMVASGTILYGDFGASGIWKFNGTAWSQIATSDPANMAVGF